MYRVAGVIELGLPRVQCLCRVLLSSMVLPGTLQLWDCKKFQSCVPGSPFGHTGPGFAKHKGTSWHTTDLWLLAFGSSKGHGARKSLYTCTKPSPSLAQQCNTKGLHDMLQLQVCCIPSYGTPRSS